MASLPEEMERRVDFLLLFPQCVYDCAAGRRKLESFSGYYTWMGVPPRIVHDSLMVVKQSLQSKSVVVGGGDVP